MSTTVGQEAKTSRQFARVCEILTRFNNSPAMLIPILQAVQAEYRYLPADVLAYVATALGLSPARVYGVATFYAHFALAPKGDYVVRFCDGTACHVKRSTALIDAARKHLGLREGQGTTDDLMFTIETVSCLGACGLAPVMVVNEAVHGQMTPDAVVEVIKTIQAKAREEVQA